MKCGQCGVDAAEGAKFCSSCGGSLSGDAGPQDPLGKLLADWNRVKQKAESLAVEKEKAENEADLIAEQLATAGVTVARFGSVFLPEITAEPVINNEIVEPVGITEQAANALAHTGPAGAEESVVGEKRVDSTRVALARQAKVIQMPLGNIEDNHDIAVDPDVVEIMAKSSTGETDKSIAAMVANTIGGYL